jgi:hypothetical protein
MSVRKFEVNPSTAQRVARPFAGTEDASVAVRQIGLGDWG